MGIITVKSLRVVEWLKGRAHSERGQALIEAAVAAPLLFVVLMGSGELARVAYVAIEVANAARAGAEYASQNQFTMSDNSSNKTNTSGSNGISRAVSSDAYNLSSVSASSSIGYICSDGSTASVSSSTLPTCPNGDTGATPIPYVTVTASATFDPLIHIPGLPTTFTLSSSATQSCLDCG